MVTSDTGRCAALLTTLLEGNIIIKSGALTRYLRANKLELDLKYITMMKYKIFCLFSGGYVLRLELCRVGIY